MKSKIPKSSPKNRKESIKIIFLAQIFLIMAITLYLCSIKWGLLNEKYYSASADTMIVILLLSSGLIGVGSARLFKEMESLIEKEKDYEMQTLQIEQMQETNDLLRSQKHDFSNNLQVLWGLLALGDIEKAKEYLNKYSETLKIDEKELMKLNRLPCSYLYTLFTNKTYKCKNMGIKINYYIQPSIPLECFNPVDIVRILGNLLDNAIYEVAKLESEDGCIIVDMHCSGEECSFHVTNKGTVIPEKIKDKIFEKGFTTKGDEGSGFGLHNVREIVKKYNGEIYVKSDTHIGTSFIVRMPRTGTPESDILKHEGEFSL